MTTAFLIKTVKHATTEDLGGNSAEETWLNFELSLQKIFKPEVIFTFAVTIANSNILEPHKMDALCSKVIFLAIFL